MSIWLREYIERRRKESEKGHSLTEEDAARNSRPLSSVTRVEAVAEPEGCTFNTYMETCGVCGHPEFCPAYGNRRAR